MLHPSVSCNTLVPGSVTDSDQGNYHVVPAEKKRDSDASSFGRAFSR